MAEISTKFESINKISFAELDTSLQHQIDLIDMMQGDMSGIYPGATKVENLGGGKLRINDVEVTVYTHPSNHPASMIVGLSNVAISGNYSDLINIPTSLPASDVYEWAKQPTKPKYTAEEVSAIAKSMKGTSNGVAELGSDGKHIVEQVPTALYQLASTGIIGKDQLPNLYFSDLKDNPSVMTIYGGLSPSDI